MARTDNLNHYLTDVADAIREAGNTSEKMLPQDFDKAIANIPAGGGNTIINIAKEHSPNTISFINYPGESFNGLGLNTYQMTNMASMFYNSPNLTSITGLNFKTNKVNNFASMFRNCGVKGKLNLSSFEGNAATSINNMFTNCRNLTELEMTNFNGCLLTNLGEAFTNCTNLVSLNLANFNGVKVVNFGSPFELFEGCPNLKTLNVSNFNSTVFNGWGNSFNLPALESIDMNSFCKDNHIGIGVSGLFKRCLNLVTVDLSNAFTNCDNFNLADFFTSCYKLQLNSLPNYLIKNTTSLLNMFCNCYSLTSFDLSNITSTKINGISGIFANCNGLTSVNMSHFNLCDPAKENTMQITNMFVNAFNPNVENTYLNLSHFNGSCLLCHNNYAYYNGLLNIVGESNVKILNLSNFYSNQLTNISFQGPAWAEHIDLSNANVAPGAIVSIDFNCSERLKTINYANTDLSGVQNWSIRQARDNLTSFDFTNTNFRPKNLSRLLDRSNLVAFNANIFKTIPLESVEYMQSLFYSSDSLTSVDLNGLHIPNPCDISGMFSYCWRLANVKFNNFFVNETNGISFSRMFYECNRITEINLSSFANKNAITNLTNAFGECRNLVTLDLTGFDAGNVYDVENTFAYCTNLTTIIGGLNNIGKAYANYNGYWDNVFTDISFMRCPLTRASALNIINGLYNLTAANIKSREILFSNATALQMQPEDWELIRQKGWEGHYISS